MTLLQEHHHQQNRQAQEVTTAACAGKTNLFFSERTADMRAAQALCATCELRDPCLEQARARPPFAGVWGGVVFVNGEEQLLKRGRGRPRKSEQLDNARILKALGAASVVTEQEEQCEGDASSEKDLVRQIA